MVEIQTKVESMMAIKQVELKNQVYLARSPMERMLEKTVEIQSIERPLYNWKMKELKKNAKKF